MVSKENAGLGFIIGFIVLTIYTGMNNNKFLVLMTSGSFLTAMFYYLLTRVDYLLIIISIAVLKISTLAKDITAGILLVWAIDIVSFPRLPMNTFPTDPSFLANSDAIIMTKIISLTNLTYPFVWKFYYIAMPIILILIVGYLLGMVYMGRKIFARG